MAAATATKQKHNECGRTRTTILLKRPSCNPGLNLLHQNRTLIISHSRYD